MAAALCLGAGPRLPAQAADQVRTNGLLEIQSVIVDGAPVPLRSDEKLRLSPRTRTVTFGFGATTNAARQYQRARGLAVTGQVDQDLLARLKENAQATTSCC